MIDFYPHISYSSLAFFILTTTEERRMIEIKHLRKEFEDTTPLKDVNAVINSGDIIAVIGPSGTGKSTLLRCINMLETPTSGQIIVDGQVINDGKCDRCSEKMTGADNCPLCGKVHNSNTFFGFITAFFHKIAACALLYLEKVFQFTADLYRRLWI